MENINKKMLKIMLDEKTNKKYDQIHSIKIHNKKVRIQQNNLLNLPKLIQAKSPNLISKYEST